MSQSGALPAPRGQFNGRLLRALRSLPAITSEGQVLAFLLMSATTMLVVSGHLILYLALAIGLAILAVGFAYPYLNTRGLSVRRDIPATAFAGEPVYIEIAVANRRSQIPSFALALADDTVATDADRGDVLHVPVVPAGEVCRVGYYARFNRRGTYRLRYIRVASSFPFMLFSRSVLIHCESEIVVYPRPGVLRRSVLPDPRGDFASAPQRQRGGDRFHGLREYRSGEDSRRIHWKSSLRRGPGNTPLVRELEVEGGDEVLIALDPALDASTRRVVTQERAISFAVTLARQLWRRGYRVHFASYGSAPFQLLLGPPPTTEWRRLLEHLARYAGKGEHTLPELLRTVKLGERRRVALVVVTGDGLTDESAAGALWSGGAARVVDVDGAGFDGLYVETQGRVVL